jgi:hypothetical protein
VLPQFPKSQKALDELWLELAKRPVAQGPMLGSLPRKPMREGNASESQTIQGEVSRTKFRKHSSSISISYPDGKGLTFDQFCAKASELGKQLAQEISKTVFDKLNEITKETGNEVTFSKGEGIQYKHLFELIEKTEVDYDENGEPFSSFFCGSEFYEDVRKKMPEWEKDPEFQSRLKELHARKKREFREREARRRLVD